MPSQTIQWFPGHMAKTRRLISENLSNVDIILEVLDARIPLSSRNPEIAKLTAGKPRIVLLNKSSLADEKKTDAFRAYLSGKDTVCIAIDCITGQGLNRIAPAMRELLREKIERWESKGMIGRRFRAMVLGVPNVGKSSLINKIAGGKRAKVENRPGVTLNKQWVPTSLGFDLMDMPGVLWPKFEDRTVGENLALTGAIKDDILDIEGLALILCNRLRSTYSDLLVTRYKLGTALEDPELTDLDLFMTIGKKRGFLISGGEINTERTAAVLIDEFRSAKIGRITLDVLPQKD
ncbi:MAG: ribosome biogenesis GTPase YlqF [Clostridia bacterium]|nr:ribosome biogenesis GTPase YlqF [Clostridia bacterium]